MIVSAPAKVNLALEVVGLEPNGYHLLETVFAWLSLDDTLELERSSTTSLSLEWLDTQARDGLNLTDDNNLVLKALKALEKSVGRPLPTRIHLTKRIPLGGGLGGGSADAAAALYGLNVLHELGYHQQQLLELALPLGADVAFGLVGGLAHGTRYGDLLTPCPWPDHLQGQALVLVLPEFRCSTPQIFSLWDQFPTYAAKGSSQRLLQASSLAETFQNVVNDLEEPAFRLHPELSAMKLKMVEAGLEGVCMSGSGSTMFGFLPSHRDWEEIERELRPLGAKVVSTTFMESSRFGFVSESC